LVISLPVHSVSVSKMSFFSRSSAPPPDAASSDPPESTLPSSSSTESAQVRELRLQFRSIMTMFSGATSTCFEKCVSKFGSSTELTVGEGTCGDRCLMKYLETMQLVGDTMKRANQQRAEQDQKMVQQQMELQRGVSMQ